MQDSKFGNNLKEVYVVLENLNMIQDLPREFMEFIKENKNDEYQFYYDVSKELVDQNISQETKEILAVIYHDFLCTKEEKERLDKILIQNEKREQEELSKKYSYENLFPKTAEKTENKEKPIVQEQTQLVQVKEENIFKKFIRKIKEFFHINK